MSGESEKQLRDTFEEAAVRMLFSSRTKVVADKFTIESSTLHPIHRRD